VSFGLAIAGDARADLQTIDIWLQEEVWDELDRLAADPSLLTPVPPGNSTVHAFSRVYGGVVHYVVITLIRNDGARTLTVLGVSVET